MQGGEPSEATGAQRFERMLRDEARRADEWSAVSPPRVAKRREREADALRDGADALTTQLPADQHESLDGISDGWMRVLARLSRYLAGWTEKGDA